MPGPAKQPRPYSTSGSNPPALVPDSQLRALDRRHALDQQQRNFRDRDPIPPPHCLRNRPPG